MRSGIAALVLAIGLALGTQASADGIHVHGDINGDHCGFDTNYDVLAKHDALIFTRAEAHPAKVVMHDGRLSIDGHDIDVSTADAARLREYEHNVRTLLPQMAGIAQEAMGIAFDSLTTVAATFGGNTDDRDRLVKKLNQTHREALVQLREGSGDDHWNEHALEQAIEEPVEKSADELATSISSEVLASLVTGKAGEIEERANSLDASLEKEMKVRSGKLEARANLMCPKFTELEQLQERFEFRLADGSKLKLLTREEHEQNSGKDQQVTKR
jgi:hypothetical protein